ncbi:CAP domain-containing protein [Aestuariivita sp.]|jgi:uncharacterized protein YkwD|uniref:CAP domain-containing protein n=1 Tax=Aestuariivita sp. TaxID=1872407 RepID=UPI0025B8B108|nr:CAP domain-containing protein [Aestuariivita sp.]
MRSLRKLAVMTAILLAPGALADPGVLADVNAQRSEAGRAPLVYSERLERVAEGHARDIARAGFFSHIGSDGSTLAERARDKGYGFCFIAENIAKGQRSGAEAMAGWTASDGHRRNMLDRRATEMGLARADGALWVMVLGRPGC